MFTGSPSRKLSLASTPGRDVLVTRHLVRQMPEHFGALRPVASLAAEVMGTTGLESGEVVRAVCEKVNPAYDLAQVVHLAVDVLGGDQQVTALPQVGGVVRPQQVGGQGGPVHHGGHSQGHDGHPMGTTGLESGEVVRAVCEKVNPACVVAVDALASRSLKRHQPVSGDPRHQPGQLLGQRLDGPLEDALLPAGQPLLCRTIQLSDTGITPGSGVGNHRMGLTRESLGVPVVALGVPTVVDGATLAADLLGPGPAPGRPAGRCPPPGWPAPPG